MSIPKEPRQLMINLMYLVLTAMLALNVSAEIIQAFFMIDHSLQSSNKLTDQANGVIESALNKQLENPIRAKFKPLVPAVAEIRKTSAEFCQYIEDLRTELVNESGGMKDDHGEQKPKGYKDKDVTTRILVNQGKGEVLAGKAQEAVEKMTGIIKSTIGQYGRDMGVIEEDFLKKMADFDKQLPLKTGDGESKKEWATSTFNQMPLASVFPILSKMQTDAKVSESMLVNYLAQLANTSPEYVDKYFPVMDTRASYVIEGEPFEANFSVSSASSLVNNVDVSVNGQGLSVKDGVASFKTMASGIGPKSLNVVAKIRNPLTGEVTSVNKTFNYEVGQRSAVVQAEKMNVIYAGVENPIAVSVAGASSGSVKVRAEGMTLTQKGGGKYVATASQGNPNAAIILSAQGMPETRYTFRVKRIPNPTMYLLNKKGGSITVSEVRAANGLSTVLEGFDFDARCSCESYQVTYVPKNDDPKFKLNSGANFSSEVKSILNSVKPSSQLFFSEIKVKCPGDSNLRDMGSLAFNIK